MNFFLKVFLYFLTSSLSSYAEAHKAFKFSSVFRMQIEAAHNVFKFVFFVSRIFQELLYSGSEHRLRRIVTSISVLDLNRATPAKFRTQIEQIVTPLEQPQFRFKT